MELHEKTCRMCLIQSGSVSLFFNPGDDPLSAKIMRRTKLVISEGDGLPTLICADCTDLLHTAHDFFNRCEASDEALRSALAETVKFEVKHEFELAEHELKFEDGTSVTVPGLEREVWAGEVASSSPGLASPSSPIHHKDPCEPEEFIKVKQKGHCSATKKCKRGKMARIQCTICGILVNSQSAMDVHLRVHTGEKPFECTQCDQRYKTSGALKRHVQTWHLPRERRFTCETCGVSFYRKNEIIQHIRRHTGERPFVCPFCSQRFLQISSLIRHKRMHTGDKPYPCQVCGKAFPDRSTLTKHSTKHSDQRNHRCHLCQKTFKSKNSLNIHIHSIHSNANSLKEAIVCNFCGVTFTMKGNLNLHIHRRHSEKSGQCTVCHKHFSNLEVHMRKHTGEKPYICDLCSKAFSRKSCLANHWLFKHRNAEKYKCSLSDCPRSFPTAAMMQFHLMKQHAQHTPHVCTHCSRGFYRPCDLTRHLRVTHNIMCIKTENPKSEVFAT